MTDRKGNPVHWTKASDFHVFDNSKPEEIASFEEHRKGDAPTNSASPLAHHTPHKGTLPYTVESSLPLDAFSMKSVKGNWKVELGAEIIALNANGALISHEAKNITFTLRDEAARHPAGRELPLEEEIDLAKADVYVYVAVFDMGSKRLGALEIPYHVDVPKRPKDTHASMTGVVYPRPWECLYP